MEAKKTMAIKSKRAEKRTINERKRAREKNEPKGNR